MVKRKQRKNEKNNHDNKNNNKSEKINKNQSKMAVVCTGHEGCPYQQQKSFRSNCERFC